MEWLAGDDHAARARAARLLAAGKLVAVPTETVYGLAADARNEDAVRTIFTVKGRPLIDPLIVHCASPDSVDSLCVWPESARRIAAAFWPGALTMVLARRPDCPLSPLVSAGLPTLAVRVPAHPVLHSLLKTSGLALAAPSANPFGYVSPTRPVHVADSLGDRIEALLDGGPCEHGVESTIVAFGDAPGTIRLLRAGPISVEDLERAAGHPVSTADVCATATPQAPGLLASHYRPGKGITLFPEGTPPAGAVSRGLATVFLQRPGQESSDDGYCFWLSESGDPEEIAHNLFDLLRRLDNDPQVRSIRVENPSSSRGILRAVRDRLRRAAAPRPEH